MLNNTSIKNNANKFFYIELGLCFIIIFSTLLSISRIASIAFYALFFALIIHFFCLKKTFDSYFIFLIVIIGLQFVNLFINLIINGVQTLSVPYFAKSLCFFSTCLFTYIISVSPIDKKTFIIVTFFGVLICFLFVVSYFLLGIRTTVGITNKLLKMNFSNPNLLALFLLNTLFFCIIGFLYVKNRALKFFIFILFALGVYLIIKTDSRTSLVCLFGFIVICILFLTVLKNKKIPNWIVLFILLVPLIFALLYTSFIDVFQSVFGFIESKGKGVDSRYSTWINALNVIKNNFIFGDYFGASGGFGGFQMHNTALDIMSSYGIFVYIFTIIFFYKIIKKLNSEKQNIWGNLALVAFLITWISGTGEAAFFSGGQGIYILSCNLIFLAKYNHG